MAAIIDYLDSVEIGLCIRANQAGRLAWIRVFFAAVSKLGDGWYWGGIAGLAVVTHGAGVLPRLAIVAIVAGVGLVVYRLLKDRLARERPCITCHGIEALTLPLDRYSFPSGHTLHAVSFAMLFSTIDVQLAWLAWPFALLVALSRVILGLHYPSDVLAGAAIGLVLALAATMLL